MGEVGWGWLSSKAVAMTECTPSELDLPNFRNASKTDTAVQKSLSYSRPAVLGFYRVRQFVRSERAPVILLSRPRRLRRANEWNAGRAVSFIVTLAATGSVTLAAREAAMSRKSAYALKSRDSAFAAAWTAACRARRLRLEGDKAHEAHEPPFSPAEGDSRATLSRPAQRSRSRRLQAAAVPGLVELLERGRKRG